MFDNKSIPDLLRKSYNYNNTIDEVISLEKRLVTEACINLRIISREFASEKENRFFHQNPQISNMPSGIYGALYPPDIPEDSKGLFDMEDMFEAGEETNIAPRKVAVYGRAGVGKSTLCKYLSIKWTEGKLGEDRFETVLWIPLRKILSCGIQNTMAKDIDIVLTQLATVVRDVCMGELPEIERPSIDNICYYLRSMRQSGQADKILIILDGYDEIGQSISDQSELQKFLKNILRDPDYHVLITSRPVEIVLDGSTMKFDRELENIGFTKENIKQYIQKLYPIQQEDLSRFIESNKHLQDISHIPLNLALVCNIYSLNKGHQQNYTVSQLYTEIINHMLDLMANKGVCWDKKLSKTVLKARQEVLLELLGEIALVGMQKKLFFKDVQRIIETKERALGLEGLFNEVLGLGIVKTIRTNKDDRYNDIYFIHHTFQEYFATRLLAQGFEAYDEKYELAVNILKEHKYTPYYEVVWLSVVGILYDKCENTKDCIPMFRFWDAFENEPRELLGMQHDRLLLKLLEAFPDKSSHQDLKGLRAEIQARTKVVQGLFKIIADCSVEPTIRLYAIDAIVELQNTGLDVVAKLKEVMLRAKEVEGIRLYAAEGLFRLGHGSKEACEVICKGPGYLKKYILAALGRIYETKYEKKGIPFGIELMIIHYIIEEFAQCKGTELEIYVAESLIRLESSKLTHHRRDEAVEFIVASLKSDNKNTQEAAIKALARMEGSHNGKDILKDVLKTLDLKLQSSIKKAMESPPQPIDFIRLALERTRDGKSAQIIMGGIRNLGATALSGLILSAIIAPSSILGTAALILFQNFSSIGVMSCISYYGISYHSTLLELDKLALCNDGNKNKLTAICSKANDDPRTIMAWSKEGLLNMTLAIRLYSYSSQAVWLEPMKDIKFLYKDASILLTILGKGDKRCIFERYSEEPLTKNWEETNAVISAMKIAYESAGSSSNHLTGVGLSVISHDDRRLLEQKRIAAEVRKMSNKPLALTELHIAASKGDVNKVVELLEQNNIDIDDQNNETGDTALMLAVSNKHWKVVDALVERGADIAFCNKSGRNAIDMAISVNANEEINYLTSKCCLKEERLEKLLIESMHLYKGANEDERIEDIIVSSLMTRLVALKDWKQNDTMVARYRMYLDDVLRLELEYPDRASNSNSISMLARPAGPHEYQSIRLSVYIELYIKLTLGLIKKLPREENSSHYNVDRLRSMLYYEIKLITGAIALDRNQLRLRSMKHIAEEKAEIILSKFLSLSVGEEYVISSGSDSHAIYVALHKLDNDRVLIRVDNRLLDGHIIRKLHGKEPYITIVNKTYVGEFGIKIEKKVEYIKSYCVGILKFSESIHKTHLLKYITKLLLDNDNSTQKYYDIYGVSLPVDSPDDLKEHINRWPYHQQQTSLGGNCTISSYNLGISARHGEGFFKWLIEQELISVPSLTPGAKTFMQQVDEDNSLGHYRG